MKKVVLAAACVATLSAFTTGAFAQSSNMQTAPASAGKMSGSGMKNERSQTTGVAAPMPKDSNQNEGAKTPSTSGADTANNKKEPGKEN